MPLKFHQTYSQSLKPPLKVYEPREDPRLFYQTDAYRREIVRKNANHYEVTFAYPGHEVVRLSEKKYRIRKPSNKRLRDLRQKVDITKGEGYPVTLEILDVIKLHFIVFIFNQ